MRSGDGRGGSPAGLGVDRGEIGCRTRLLQPLAKDFAHHVYRWRCQVIPAFIHVFRAAHTGIVALALVSMASRKLRIAVSCVGVSTGTRSPVRSLRLLPAASSTWKS